MDYNKLYTNRHIKKTKQVAYNDKKYLSFPSHLNDKDLLIILYCYKVPRFVEGGEWRSGTMVTTDRHVPGWGGCCVKGGGDVKGGGLGREGRHGGCGPYHNTRPQTTSSHLNYHTPLPLLPPCN